IPGSHAPPVACDWAGLGVRRGRPGTATKCFAAVILERTERNDRRIFGWNRGSRNDWSCWGMRSCGEQAARRLKRAQILLATDSGQGEEAIALAARLGGGISTVNGPRRRLVEGNLEGASSEDP